MLSRKQSILLLRMFFIVLPGSRLRSFSSSLGGSNLCADSVCASLMVKMPDKVPRGSRLARNKVLFFLTIEKIRSSSAFEGAI